MKAPWRRQTERPAAQAECSLVLHEARREAFWRGQRLDLSPTEFAVLAYLYQRVGQAVSNDALLQTVWDTSLDEGGSLAQVRNAVTRLRQKLATVGARSCRIVNVRGVGYRLELCSTGHARRPLRFPLVLSTKRIVLLALLVVTLLAGIYVWRQLPRDPGAVVWYRSHRVPLAAFRIIKRGGYCTAAPDGAIYCFDTQEELAAATGLPMPGVDPEAVRRLWESGAVPDLR